MSQHDAASNEPVKNDPTLSDHAQGDSTQGDPTQGDTAQADETTTIESLLDEPDSAQARPSVSPEPAATPASEPVSGTDSRPADPSPAQPYASPPASPFAGHEMQPAVPEFKSGPAPTTSVFGLLGLLTAIAVLVSQATDLDIPWGVVGPVAVVGAGVLLVVLGLAGLRGQRFRG